MRLSREVDIKSIEGRMMGVRILKKGIIGGVSGLGHYEMIVS